MENRRKQYLSPIQSLDFYLDNFNRLCKKLKLANDLSELKRVLNRDLEPSIIDLLQSSSYQALVVTDLERTIVWANNGFHEMTGYSKKYALGKRPTFLQGENTSESTRREVRSALAQQKRFSKVLVNYRKNGEEYNCKIDIMPLFNSSRVVTHYLAMERELLAA